VSEEKKMRTCVLLCDPSPGPVGSIFSQQSAGKYAVRAQIDSDCTVGESSVFQCDYFISGTTSMGNELGTANCKVRERTPVHWTGAGIVQIGTDWESFGDEFILTPSFSQGR
jgi:hypothetical protein